MLKLGYSMKGTNIGSQIKVEPKVGCRSFHLNYRSLCFLHIFLTLKPTSCRTCRTWTNLLDQHWGTICTWYHSNTILSILHVYLAKAILLMMNIHYNVFELEWVILQIRRIGKKETRNHRPSTRALSNSRLCAGNSSFETRRTWEQTLSLSPWVQKSCLNWTIVFTLLAKYEFKSRPV